jgi:hypothetical protein
MRLLRALKMAVLFVWMLLDMLENEIKSNITLIGALHEGSRSEDGK